jgi:glycyl-tRNA synthetase beta chain
MPELLLELFSEEIPARMQARGGAELSRSVAAALAPVMEGAPRHFFGPRRIGLAATLRAAVTTEGKEERGPRVGAPEAALAGFLRKHGVAKDALAERGGFWVLDKPGESVAARELIARAMPQVIRDFSWPKSMRWGESGFAWVRPLHRILCLLDGAVVQFDLRHGDDAVHGLASGDLTEGHRVMAPGAFAVQGVSDYQAKLRERRVILDAAERMRVIEEGLAKLAAERGVAVVPDRGLLEEVAGLVEWPVPLIGRIDAAFMDLPPEVMRTTMRVNQRYFSVISPDGSAAPFFGVVANIVANDGGAALVAGNERVLRARLSDARFFWDQDRKQKLEDFLPKLDDVVFHAKLGTQGDRVRRLEKLARFIAPMVGADPALAARAAKLAKADLASGMVGEFPELQGVMGRYYALHAGEDERVAEAIGSHYRPLGPEDAVPTQAVAAAAALADKLDTLAGFFRAGERPTGSGDPFALRRAALGVLRIVRENGLQFRLREALLAATMEHASAGADEGGQAVADLVSFLTDRLKVVLRAEGARHDIVDACLVAGGSSFGDQGQDDILRLLARADALKALVESETGGNLLAACKRAANILRIEDRKDGPHAGAVDSALLTAPEERALAAALDTAEPAARDALAREDFPGAMDALAKLRAPLDAFFDHVTVNDANPERRRNRLRLLARLRAAMDAVADFSKIEG